MTVEAPAAPAGNVPPSPLAAASVPVQANVVAVRLLAPGLIEVQLPPNGDVGGPEAVMAAVAVQDLAEGKRVALMIVVSGVVGVSVDARRVYAESVTARAVALVGESPVDRVIAHYLLRSRSESIPAEFFLSRPAALEWLRQYTA